MKKIIILIVFITGSILSHAQNPMDERLYDEVKLKIGDDATEISACSGSKTENQSHTGSCSVTLNKDVLYRFTCGNSKKSSGILKEKLTFKENNQLIKVVKVKVGEILSFEFLCTKTGNYSLQSYYDDLGYCYNVTIISKVNQ
ncbi:hypothetical protein [Carboxylicivirga linearis]|uniref:Uncharacterized protein n=1 Tax=Carboxylicivirga linearis TaxID=1628157 RepID=A0ABS5JY52_9BACT|nr:hypothetical protein [Carboxylicivirga linearis]MBS2099839.1 hypothetical protein [Carboxylicivirga linearis]